MQTRKEGRVRRGEATCNPAIEDAPPIAAVRQRWQRQPWSRRRHGLLRPLPLLGTPHRSHGRRGDQERHNEDSVDWDVVPPKNKVFLRTGFLWVLWSAAQQGMQRRASAALWPVGFVLWASSASAWNMIWSCNAYRFRSKKKCNAYRFVQRGYTLTFR